MASPFTPTAAPTANRATEPMADPGRPDPTTRSLGRRPSLPGGRALVGAALVVAAAVMTYAAYLGATTKPLTKYVVAARDLRVNDRVTAGDFTTVDGDLPPDVSQHAFSSPAELDGAVVLASVSQGSLVNRSAVLAKGQSGGARPGYELSFTVPAWKLGSGMQVGELIDLQPIGDTKDGSRPLAQPVQGVRVINLKAGSSGGLGSNANDAVVTVAADDPTDYQAVVAVVQGDFWVVRSTRSTGGAAAAPPAAATAPATTATTLTTLPSSPFPSVSPTFPTAPPSAPPSPTTVKRP
jgi:hypothetical protein